MSHAAIRLTPRLEPRERDHQRRNGGTTSSPCTTHSPLLGSGLASLKLPLRKTSGTNQHNNDGSRLLGPNRPSPPPAQKAVGLLSASGRPTLTTICSSDFMDPNDLVPYILVGFWMAIPCTALIFLCIVSFREARKSSALRKAEWQRRAGRGYVPIDESGRMEWS
jgi:hypothetical protein